MNLSSCSITKSELGFSISSLEEKVRRLSLFRSPSPPSFLLLLSLLSTRPAVPPTSELQDPPARFPWPRSCSLQSPLRQGLTESALHTSFISDHRSAQDPCLHPLIAAGHGFMLDQVRSDFLLLNRVKSISLTSRPSSRFAERRVDLACSQVLPNG